MKPSCGVLPVACRTLAKRITEQRNADVIIFVDSCAEARLGERSTLDPALRAAASLAARYLRQKDRVGFVTFGDERQRWIDMSMRRDIEKQRLWHRNGLTADTRGRARLPGTIRTKVGLWLPRLGKWIA